MFTKLTATISVCLLGAGLQASPAMAEPLSVEGRSVAQERVSYGDLDLRQSADQRKLKTRVRFASEHVCGMVQPIPTYGFGPDPKNSKTCADLTYDATRPQIAAAIQRDMHGQASMAMARTISLPGRTR